MQLIDSPTERTTAATDAILAAQALGCAVYVWSIGDQDLWKASLWASAFCLLALAAVLGAVAHGFKMSPGLNRLIWQPLNLALGLVIALFVVGVTYDRWGIDVAQRLLPVMIGLGIIFFIATQFVPGSFLVFVIYQTVAMLFALLIYGWLAINGQLAGAAFMAGGVLVTMIAAGIQARQSVSLNLVWQFDHNGVYHLVQMVGLLLLLAGLQASL